MPDGDTSIKKSVGGGINLRDVFIVDVDDYFLRYIPEGIKKDAKYRNHLLNNLDDPKDYALAQYNEYKNNARLVITSRLHCAIPCLAAGIPTILLKDKISYRFSWLEKILPIYTLSNINEVNWNPSILLTEEHKRKILNLTINRLNSTFIRYSEMYDISYFYENREKNEYVNDACLSFIDFIDNNLKDKNAYGEYAFWGLTQMSEYVFDYISRHYPNMKLTHVYDSFRSVKFKGLTTESPDNIRFRLNEIVFVTTNGAEQPAKLLFDKIKKPKETYCFWKIIQ